MRTTALRVTIPAVIALSIGAGIFHAARRAQGGKPPASKAAYIYTDLAGFAGGDFVQTEAFGISNPDAGGDVAIAGSAYVFPLRRQHPVLWQATGAGALVGLLDLGVLPPRTEALALDVNDAGLAIGIDDSNVGPGFVAVPGVGLVPLPALGGSTSWPYAINNRGEIVGEAAVDGTPTLRGALWHVDAQGTITGPVDLGAFHPHDINDLGVMSGWHGGAGTPAIARFDAGALQVTLLSLGNGIANAINIHGDVVGYTFVGSVHRAFLCLAGGSPVLLPDKGGPQNYARDINDQGLVVGTVGQPRGGKSGANYSPRAALWEDGSLFDLNVLAGLSSKNQLRSAEGINSAGQIVGYAWVTLGSLTELHGFLLSKRP